MNKGITNKTTAKHTPKLFLEDEVGGPYPVCQHRKRINKTRLCLPMFSAYSPLKSKHCQASSSRVRRRALNSEIALSVSPLDGQSAGLLLLGTRANQENDGNSASKL